MPMSRRLAGIFIAIAAIALPAVVYGAGDVLRLSSAEKTHPQRIAAVTGSAVSQTPIAPADAATRSGLEAMLDLARKYASDESVPGSSARAFELYQRIVDDHADIRATDKAANHVAQAFVALGAYYRTGIEGTRIKADMRHAMALVWHAASYLGDADAQCTLAEMLLDGKGIARNSQLAVNWLANAAKKRHAKAQAMLGDLLLRGAPDVRAQPEKGLALLTLALQNAATKTESLWINGLLADARKNSNAAVSEGAARLVALWEPHFGQQVEVVASNRKAPEHAALTKVGLESAPAQR